VSKSKLQRAWQWSKQRSTAYHFCSQLAIPLWGHWGSDADFQVAWAEFKCAWLASWVALDGIVAEGAILVLGPLVR